MYLNSNFDTVIGPNHHPKKNKGKIGKTSLFVIAATLLASRAEAQTIDPSTSNQVSLEGIEGVDNVEQNLDGSVKVTLENGEIITLTADQVTIVDGQVFVTESTLEAVGFDQALSVSSSSFLTSNGLLIAGGVAAAIGVGIAASSGSDDDAPAPPPPPTNSAPQFTSSSSANFAENGTDAVLTATATDADGDTVTFSIVGGDDADLFEIDSATGELTFTGSPDFENPTDADGNNAFDVIIQATDGTDTTDQTVTVTVTNINDNAPEFTSDPAVSVEENTTETGFVASATDLDGDVVTFSITGGADAALFVIDPETGALSFVNAPDFENPTDADGDNVFDVVVTASDGENTVDQTVTLTVTDSIEASSIFIGAPGSSFLDATNFEDGILPDAQDEVLIDLGPTDDVLFGGTLEIAGLTSNADFRLNSGSLTSGFINLGEGAELFLAGGNLVNATVNGNIVFDAENASALIPSELSGVTLNGDLDFTNTSGNGNRRIEVDGGLTLNGDLSVNSAADGTADATLQLTESQTIDGTGTIFLGDARADHKDDAASTILVFGPGTLDVVFGEDITIAGSGFVDAGFNGTIQILGNVVATGGNFLELSDIDNLGETLTIDATDGSIGLSDDFGNAVINGEGVIDLLGFLDITNTTFNVGARVDGAHGNVDIDVFDGLTINDTLQLIDSEEAFFVRLDVSGAQTFDGTGEILLSRGDTPIGERSGNQINFIGENGGEAEVLVFGEDLTIRGDGAIDGTTFGNNDTVQILGTLAGIENGFLSVSELDNQGEAITIEQSAGVVAFEGNISNTIFDGEGALIDFIGGTVNFENLVFNTDVRVGAVGGPGETNINLADDLTINGDFSLLDVNAQGGSELRITSEAGEDIELNGTGTIILGDTRENSFDTLFTFDDTQIIFSGADGRDTVETLIIGEDIDIVGSGFISANGPAAFGDTVQILGSATGIEDGVLVLQNLDNEGASLTVDASARDGSVVISVLATDTVFDVVDGGLEFAEGTYNNITINGDAFVRLSSNGFGGLTFEDGLEVNGTLAHQTASSIGPTVDFVDSQTISGDGEIILSITDTDTPLRFSAGDDNLGFFNSDIDAGRSLITIDEGITISGTGSLIVNAGTTLDIDGTIRSDGLIFITQTVDIAVLDPDPANDSNIDFADATLGGGFGTIDFNALSVLLNPLNSNDFLAESIAFTETTTFEVALDGATGQHSDFLFSLADLGNAAVELNVTNAEALTLGQTFTVFDERASNDGFGSQIADNVTFFGDFGSFINFDLEGDFAFILQEVLTPVPNDALVDFVRRFDLVVVTDQEAIDAGFIDAPATSSAVSPPTSAVSAATIPQFDFDFVGLDLGRLPNVDQFTRFVEAQQDLALTSSSEVAEALDLLKDSSQVFQPIKEDVLLIESSIEQINPDFNPFADSISNIEIDDTIINIFDDITDPLIAA